MESEQFSPDLPQVAEQKQPSPHRRLRVVAAAITGGAVLAAAWLWFPRGGGDEPSRSAFTLAPVAVQSSGARLSGVAAWCPADAPPREPTAEQRQEADQEFLRGTQIALVGDLRAARDLYREALRLDPTNPAVAYRLARVYEELGENTQAATEYCRFLDLSPDAADFRDVERRIAWLVPLDPRNSGEAAPTVIAMEEVSGEAEDRPSTAAASVSPEPDGEAPRQPEQGTPPTPVPAPRGIAIGSPVPSEPAAPLITDPSPPPPLPRAPERTAAVRDEIHSVIGSYSRAIESRDLAALREAYPGLTPEQQRAWETFFGNVRDLQTTLQIETLKVEGPIAEVRVNGAYAYHNRSLNRDERTPISFEAVLTRNREGWRLDAIR